jgi:hypothetical protein
MKRRIQESANQAGRLLRVFREFNSPNSTPGALGLLLLKIASLQATGDMPAHSGRYYTTEAGDVSSGNDEI